MGCFIACFGGANDRKQRRRSKKPLPINRVYQSNHPLQTSTSPQKPIIEEAAALADAVSVPELREKQEQSSFRSCRKRVTFDLNVKTYEDIAVREDIDDRVEADDAHGDRKALETEGNVCSVSNYRYENCESSDEDDDAEVYDDGSDFDEEDGEVAGTEEESYESFFSLPMDKEKQQESCEEEEEVDGPMPISISAKGCARDRSQHVHSVLNPVENLLQWKRIKLGALPLKNIDNKLETEETSPDKENSQFGLETKVTGFSPKPAFKANRHLISTPNHGNTKQEISVDTSLSTWLVPSENSRREETLPQGSNSPLSNSSVNWEDRPILGALTVEDLKQSSATSSPRRSPSRNPDEIPILGAVGSYWNTESLNPRSPKASPEHQQASIVSSSLWINFCDMILISISFLFA